MSESIHQEIIRIITKTTKIPADRIHIDSKFEDLGIDSLDLTNLLYEIEEAYNLTIPDEEIKNLRSISQVITLLAKLGVE